MTRVQLRRYLLMPALAACVTFALHAAGALERLEWMSYDQRMQWTRGDAAPDPRIAVILIDEAALAAMNPLVGRFPWPRSIYADLMEFLALGAPRAVVFDLLFSEYQRGGGAPDAHDLRLVEASAALGTSYHAFQLMRDDPDDVYTHFLDRPLPDDFRTRFGVGAGTDDGDRRNNNYVLPFAELYRASRGAGVVNLEPDSDGVYRRTRPLRAYHGELYPLLGLAPLLAAPTQHGAALASLPAAAADGGEMLINYHGRPRPYSISGVFASLQAIRAGDIESLLIHPDEFRDKIVFIGASAAGLQDTKPTPLSPKTPGVLIHASLASNLLTGDTLRTVPRPLTWLAIAVAALLPTLGLFRLHRLYQQVLYPVALATLYGLWCVWQFEQHVVYEMAAPLCALTLSWLLGIGYLGVTEGRDKRRVRRMLSQYVSPAVLAEVVDRYQDHVQAEVGRKEDVTILFADIRGFTTLSERLPAEQVVDLLNCYFSEMTEIIFAHGGTLDKFIGDAIMAFWGAPVRVGNHAEAAVTAALQMLRRLDAVNHRLQARGYPAITIGIGLNSGAVVLGNIGSEKKLDYTVIGDHVNLASRLEGLTAQYGCPLLVSEFTRSRLGERLPCAVVDLVRVKGKQQPVALYQPLALADDEAAAAAHALAARTTAAFEHYRARRWDAALTAYQALPPSALRELFVERCRRCLAEPPPADWDGVYLHTRK